MQCTAVCSHMGGFPSFPCSLDAACSSVTVPTVRCAQCNDMRSYLCYRPYTLGYCEDSAVDFFYSRAPATGYVFFCCRFVGMAAKDSRVEVGFLCVVACTTRGTLYRVVR